MSCTEQMISIQKKMEFKIKVSPTSSAPLPLSGGHQQPAERPRSQRGCHAHQGPPRTPSETPQLSHQAITLA